MEAKVKKCMTSLLRECDLIHGEKSILLRTS